MPLSSIELEIGAIIIGRTRNRSYYYWKVNSQLFHNTAMKNIVVDVDEGIVNPNFEGIITEVYRCCSGDIERTVDDRSLCYRCKLRVWAKSG